MNPPPTGIASDVAGYLYSMFVSSVLPPDLRAPAHARALVRATLTEWELADLVDDAELVTSELVANGVRHGETPVVLTLARRADALLIAVQDAAPDRLPQPRSAGAEETSGRGMFLVDLLAARWGCTTEDEHKTVWAELAAPERS